MKGLWNLSLLTLLSLIFIKAVVCTVGTGCPSNSCPLFSNCHTNGNCECWDDHYEFANNECRWRIRVNAICNTAAGSAGQVPLYNKPYSEPCVTNAQCIATMNDEKYRCMCNEGYFPHRGLCLPTRKPDSVCSGDISDTQCVDNAKCIQEANGGFKCKCGPGYTDGEFACVKVSTPIGGHCTNIDVCATANAECVSKMGNSYCDCKQGYYRDTPSTCSLQVALNVGCGVLKGEGQCADRNAACILYNNVYQCRCLWNNPDSDNSYCLPRNAYNAGSGWGWNDDYRDEYYDIVIAVSVTFAVCFVIVCIVCIIVVVYKSRYYDSGHRDRGQFRTVVESKPENDNKYVFVQDQPPIRSSSRTYSVPAY